MVSLYGRELLIEVILIAAPLAKVNELKSSGNHYVLGIYLFYWLVICLNHKLKVFLCILFFSQYNW